MFRKFLLFMPLCLSTLYANAAEGDRVGYIGYLHEDINQSGVFEVGFRAPYTDFTEFNVAAMWFAHDQNLYEGLNAGFHLTTGTWPLKAYMGAGFFTGEHKQCDKYYNYAQNNYDYRDCDSDLSIGVYPEVGVELSFLNLRLASYARYYRTADSGKNEYRMYGAYIGLSF
ncbi:hypothetical protein [Vibrio mangrovi]|uniref:Outer membrane protein beta-barrel domain-containing protein n=1 Tax=Vibrio mangrovi TaxID=474394 RepID=A0A1Y6ISN3_9VIBR|nr:hypothetical protein [Vibrio mangrovi]MDW6004120.1 hypothetical protein [Vibrio mangrovi]SMR99083.1 hypothetical protein VIM7927_00305 [Vibrio mangrovi]